MLPIKCIIITRASKMSMDFTHTHTTHTHHTQLENGNIILVERINMSFHIYSIPLLALIWVTIGRKKYINLYIPIPKYAWIQSTESSNHYRNIPLGYNTNTVTNEQVSHPKNKKKHLSIARIFCCFVFLCYKTRSSIQVQI